MSLNRSDLLAEIAQYILDNSTGLITPAALRQVLNDITNNVWTLQDPQTVSGVLSLASPPILPTLNGVLRANGASAITAISPGQLPATATNDNAPSGDLGEYLEATVTNLALTTATPANVGSVSLTAGDWDVWGNVSFVPAGTTTVSSIAAATSTTSAVFPGSNLDGGYHSLSATMTTGVAQMIPVGVQRRSVAGSTTVYLVCQASFAVSTMQGNGKICARRAR